MDRNIRLSVVIPIYNEEECIGELYREITDVCRSHKLDYEIIGVDDGSTDTTRNVLEKLASLDDKFRLIALKRNFGQTAALAAGLDQARGEYIVTMDGDLQNDPADIPRLLAKCQDGFDLVCGWRKKRSDPFFSKSLPSHFANKLIMKVTGVSVHDTGCTLKVFRREIIGDLHLYGEMHRFIPALLFWNGAKITELEVNHRKRAFGKSKYKLSKVIRVLLDLITVKFLLSYSTRPIQFFGKIGMVTLLLSFITGLLVILMKKYLGLNMTGNPFLFITVLLAFSGIQFVTIGLLGEMNLRIYHELGNKKIYKVDE